MSTYLWLSPDQIPEGVSDEEGVLLGDILSTAFFCAENAFNDSQPAASVTTEDNSPPGKDRRRNVEGGKNMSKTTLFLCMRVITRYGPKLPNSRTSAFRQRGIGPPLATDYCGTP